MTNNWDALAKAPDSVLALAASPDGQPTIFWGDSRLGLLTKGKNLLSPEIKFDPALKEMTSDNARKTELRIGRWVEEMKVKHLEGLVKIDALANDATTPASVRALFAQIVEAGGIIARRQVDGAVRALDDDKGGDMRGVARRGGLVFGALDIFHHALMKPGAVLWRTALFAALHEEAMIKLPPDNAVHLKDWKFAHADDASRLGFRNVKNEYVRVDMAERLIKQAHEARQQGNIFAVDPALATSLGLSTETHEALLDMAGFVKTEQRPVPAEVKEPTDSSNNSDVVAAKEPSAVPKAIEQKIEEDTSDKDMPTIYWLWKGMGKNQARGKPKHHRKKTDQKNISTPKSRKPEPVLATGGGAFAELAALKESMKK